MNKPHIYKDKKTGFYTYTPSRVFGWQVMDSIIFERNMKASVFVGKLNEKRT